MLTTNRCADFTPGYKSNAYNQGGGSASNRHRQQQSGAADDNSFQLVDTTRAPKKFVAPAKKRAQHQSRLRQLNARARSGMEQQKDRYNQVCVRVCMYVVCVCCDENMDNTFQTIGKSIIYASVDLFLWY